MYASVATGQVLPGKMDDFIKIYDETQKSVNKGTQGFQSARLLTDPSNNKAVAVSIWATDSDARAAATGRSIEELMKRFEGVMAGTPTFEYYEVNADY